MGARITVRKWWEVGRDGKNAAAPFGTLEYAIPVVSFIAYSLSTMPIISLNLLCVFNYDLFNQRA